MTVISIRAAVLALAGCALSALPAGAASERVVYSFRGGSDGDFPTGGVIGPHGTFHGTTLFGGAGDCSVNGFSGCGTVFSVTKNGAEKVVHTFQGKPDGAYPSSGLIDVGGTFYGTTESGGTYNAGTVFSVTGSGVETVIYSFKGDPDGSTPVARLREVGGTLYGTTYNGGYGAGTIFSVTPAGTEKVLHSFGGLSDGQLPSGRLLEVNGALYGTTLVGGSLDAGTVFSVTPAGKYTVVYDFRGGGDGADPKAGLTEVGGLLYGTTQEGGAGCGCGTVFSVTPAGSESVVYSFMGGSDGADPVAGLKAVGGLLYGTTFEGGGTGCDGFGCGTVFSVTPQGKEAVVYSFTGGGDGEEPMAGMDRQLYGTTYGGGAHGDGVVFSVTP